MSFADALYLKMRHRLRLIIHRARKTPKNKFRTFQRRKVILVGEMKGNIELEDILK